MEKFTTLTGVAAPLPLVNVDTDKIIPKQFLKTIERTGLGKGLFHELRTDADGNNTGEFVLDREPYTNAKVIVAGENFGCGSSREHAPWALFDYGFKAVIAPSFGEIFYNNCLKNGLLPSVLADIEVDHLFPEVEAFPGFRLMVDLEQQVVSTLDGGTVYRFEIDAFIVAVEA